jgi:hypothetical protein
MYIFVNKFLERYGGKSEDGVLEMCPEFGDIYENPRYIDIISLRKGKQGSE